MINAVEIIKKHLKKSQIVDSKLLAIVEKCNKPSLIKIENRYLLKNRLRRLFSFQLKFLDAQSRQAALIVQSSDLI